MSLSGHILGLYCDHMIHVLYHDMRVCTMSMYRHSMTRIFHGSLPLNTGTSKMHGTPTKPNNLKKGYSSPKLFDYEHQQAFYGPQLPYHHLSDIHLSSFIGPQLRSVHQPPPPGVGVGSGSKLVPSA